MNAMPSFHRRCDEALEPGPRSWLSGREHLVMVVDRETARVRQLAARLSREADVAVDILSADLSDEADVAAVEERLRRDDRVGVVVDNAGLTFMLTFARAHPGAE